MAAGLTSRLRWPVVLVLGAALLAACGADDAPGPAPADHAGHADHADHAEGDDPAAPDGEAGDAQGAGHHGAAPVKARPLRPGERRLTLEMPTAYTPSAPTGVGTDDYRCFLLDPELDRDTYLTGTTVRPGNPDVVHHVILFQVPPGQVADAERLDREVEGPGWTCFGGTGVDEFANVDDAQWLGAWAPGSREAVYRPGLGVELEAGTRIAMQVHYNLIAGDAPDVSAAQLRLARPGAELTGLHTMLLPAPVELPCRPAHDDSPLCDRATALADVKARFGDRAGATADVLYFLCGGAPAPGNTQSCTRTLSAPATIYGVAGHMHLLGRSIRIEVNPDTDRARTVLDVPLWNFDDQGAQPIDPVRLNALDQVKVTCRHEQWLRDKLPAFEGQDERYVVWGEGTTDEMCLGMLQVTRP